MHNRLPIARRLLAVAAAALITGGAAAQEQVLITRGTDPALPFTIIYPEALRPIEDGSATTLLTLRHPDAPLQCDIFSVAGAAGGWTAENAVANLDIAGIEATWAADFPSFRIVEQRVTDFASGPALLYEGESDNSPLGVPLRIVHAETIDNDRTYAVECLIGRSVEAEARPLVDFVIANFSTRSDADCCVDPTATD
jgi:hypothetical protein